jgi:hypothetical protein
MAHLRVGLKSEVRLAQKKTFVEGPALTVGQSSVNVPSPAFSSQKKKEEKRRRT